MHPDPTIEDVIAFFESVIRSGGPWTDKCEEMRAVCLRQVDALRISKDSGDKLFTWLNGKDPDLLAEFLA